MHLEITDQDLANGCEAIAIAGAIKALEDLRHRISKPESYGTVDGLPYEILDKQRSLRAKLADIADVDEFTALKDPMLVFVSVFAKRKEREDDAE